jgi:hypothetical protein
VHQRTGSEIRLLDDHPTVATIRLAKHRPDGIVDRSHWLNRACPARPATHVQPRGPPGVLFRSDCWPMPPDTAAPQGWHRVFRAVRSGSAAGVVAAGGRQRSWRGRCHFPCARRWRCRRPRRGCRPCRVFINAVRAIRSAGSVRTHRAARPADPPLFPGAGLVLVRPGDRGVHADNPADQPGRIRQGLQRRQHPRPGPIPLPAPKQRVHRRPGPYRSGTSRHRAPTRVRHRLQYRPLRVGQVVPPRHRYSGHEVAVSTVGLGRRTTYRRPRPLSSPTPCPTITPDQPPQQTSIQDLAPGRPPLRSAHRTVRVPRMPRVRWAGIRQ